MLVELFDANVIVPIIALICAIVLALAKQLDKLIAFSILAWLILLVFWGILAIVSVIVGGHMPDFGDAILALRGVSDYAIASIWVIVPTVIIKLVKVLVKAFKK